MCRHCGVWDSDRKRKCTRSLTCKSHSLFLKRAVIDRPGLFDVMVAQRKAEKEKSLPPETKKQLKKTTISSKNTVVEASDDDDDETLYEVEKILNKRKRSGEVQYLVKWLGYSQTDNSWEPQENLDCEEKIWEFEKISKSNKSSIFASHGCNCGQKFILEELLEKHQANCRTVTPV